MIGQVHLLVYYIKLKSRLSVRTVTPLCQPCQPCQHVLKPDLLDMKAEYSGMTKYAFKSLHVGLITHPHECAKGTGVS